MTAPWSLIFLIAALCLFAGSALSRIWSAPNAPWPYQLHLVSAGLAFWVLSQLVGK